MTEPGYNIEKLIAELCPEGVEFKELGEICEIADNKRKPIKSSLRVAGETPYYGANNIQDYVEGFTHDGEYILLAEDGSANLENYSVQYVNGKFWANNHVHVIKGLDEVLNRFLFHWFRNMNFIPFLTGGTRAKLTKAKMLVIKIPIPPLEVQEAIVKILDTFTELEARKKQYEYYRDELLTFGEDVELNKLSNLAIYSKDRIDAENLSADSYVGVDNLLQNKQGKVLSNYVPNVGRFIKYQNNDILVGNIRPYLKKIWHATNTGGTNGDVLVIRIRESERSKFSSSFLYHILASDKFFDYNMQFAKGAKMPRGDKTAIMNYPIPIPPLPEQERIVAILDKFDALVSDISIGLPAEIEARRKQYEYYRSKLLTFKPLEKEYAEQ